jgi:hypothetical protein
MAFDRFMIAPNDGGLQTDLRPFMIPDNAFATMTNTYVFRGRVRKRFGSRPMQGSAGPVAGFETLASRLRINIGTTDGSGNLAVSVPGVTTAGRTGMMFSVGNALFTVSLVGTPANMLSTTAATGTFNTTTGAVVITGATPATIVYYYPALPVMGLVTYDVQANNDEPVIAFDTQFSYEYTATGWEQAGTEVWTGTNAQFFWGTTWQGITPNVRLLFVTNYNDPIRYWDGSTWTTPTFTINAGGDELISSRIIVPFKDRLVALNTIEEVSGVPTTFINRARFSQNGSPLDADAWRQDIVGRGSFIDCPTSEAIVTVEFVKDRLIVFFERSTWELAYTGNQVLPFVWQQINTELGAESTFSVVPFDQVALGVGNVGIHACNGSNVERIDSKIPDLVFEIHNDSDGVERVYGIRDYYVEMVYWTLPSIDRTDDFPYPDRVLVYNYKTGVWAINEDSITCFGHYQQSFSQTWANSDELWGESLENWGGAILQARFRQIIAGNQEGFVFIIDPDYSRNAPALQITNMTNAGIITVIDHNLSAGDYVIIENAQGITSYNDNIYLVNVIDRNTFTILTNSTGTYTGGGTIARVSNINIVTKQYNFYAKEDRNMFVPRVSFQVDRTDDGELTVEYFTSSSSLPLANEAEVSGSALGTSVLETHPYPLYPYEATQDRLWHQVYLQADGTYIQLRLFMSPAQITNPDIAFSDFELHGMVFYASRGSARLQ